MADVMDRENLLAAVRGVRADAVMHQLTALDEDAVRHAGMAGTERAADHRNRPPPRGRPGVGAHRFLTQSIVFGYGYRDHGDRT